LIGGSPLGRLKKGAAISQPSVGGGQSILLLREMSDSMKCADSAQAIVVDEGKARQLLQETVRQSADAALNGPLVDCAARRRHSAGEEDILTVAQLPFIALASEATRAAW
jgi:hypothetical protein